MSSIKKFHFNLVEITLAVAVIAIGMGSILVLFPVGVNSHKEAIANNNLSEISEYILSALESKVMEDWARTTFTGYDPDTPGSINSSQSGGSDFITNLPANKPADTVIEPTGFTPGDKVGLAESENKNDANLHAKFFTTNKPGVFFYEQATVVDGERVPDFSAVIRLWKEPVKIWLPTEQNINDYRYAVSLNLEISWPAEAPYENREKRSYKLDLYNTFYNPVTPDTTPPVTP